MTRLAKRKAAGPQVHDIVGEGSGATTTSDPAFDAVTLGAWKYHSGVVLVSWELLQDASMNLGAWLSSALGRRIGLTKSVDTAYLGRASFMMSPGVAGYIRTLQDSSARFVWEANFAGSEPDRLLGYPVTINPAMQATLTTDKLVVAFGDFKSGYYIRDAGPVTFGRLDELYAVNGRVGFYAWMRSDGAPIDTEAYRVLTTKTS